MNADNTEFVIAYTSSGAEALAKKLPKARFVCAFKTVPSEVLFGVFEVRRSPGISPRPGAARRAEADAADTAPYDPLRRPFLAAQPARRILEAPQVPSPPPPKGGL